MDQSPKYRLNMHDVTRIGTVLLFGTVSYVLTSAISLLPSMQFVQDPQVNGIIITALTTLGYTVKRLTEGK